MNLEFNKTIYLGTDHAGFELKEEVKNYLFKKGYHVVDMGAFEFTKEDDYPDYIGPVAQMVSDNPENSVGIIFGATGQGEAMHANKFPHVRAAVLYRGEEHIVKLSREHNDANILSLGARFIEQTKLPELIELWLHTPFSNDERHMRRLTKGGLL